MYSADFSYTFKKDLIASTDLALLITAIENYIEDNRTNVIRRYFMISPYV